MVKFRDLSHRSIDLQDTNISQCFARPLAGGGAGETRAPPPPHPEILRLELISATKVEFCYYNRQLSMEATVSK